MDCPKNFRYKLDYFGTINEICTVSPTKKVFYRISDFREINMGNMGASIAFYSIDGKLFYHHKGTLAHLLSISLPDLVYWSDDANMCMFYEFKPRKIYDMIVIDLEFEKCYRISLPKFESEEINRIFWKENFSSNEAKYWLAENNITAEECIKDEVITKRSIFDFIFGTNRWYPKAIPRKE